MPRIAYIALAWHTVTVTSALSAFSVLALGMFGAIGLMFHPLFPIPVIFTIPFLALANWGEVRPKALLIILTVVPLLCLLPNLLWILPSIHYAGWSGIGNMSPFQKTVNIGILLSGLSAALRVWHVERSSIQYYGFALPGLCRRLPNSGRGE